jgi:hypothetical protein
MFLVAQLERSMGTPVATTPHVDVDVDDYHYDHDHDHDYDHGLRRWGGTAGESRKKWGRNGAVTEVASPNFAGVLLP